MKTRSVAIIMLITLSSFFLYQCKEGNSSESNKTKDTTVAQNKYGGFANEVAYGKHLVQISGCNDCHTPKKMTAMGPVLDTTLLLSGHPAAIPVFDINRKEIESKGLAVTNDMTTWVGPWGISYSANLTPDSTGVGEWNEAQFFRAIREGKWMGLEGNRQLLPPMPWQEIGKMKDDELRAVFAYLKSIPRVHNIVPPPAPPVAAPRHG